MRNIDVIFRELQQHPEYIGGVIWTTEDLMHTLLLQEVNAGSENVATFAKFVDMNGWEDVAIQDGWEVLTSQCNALYGKE